MRVSRGEMKYEKRIVMMYTLNAYRSEDKKINEKIVLLNYLLIQLRVSRILFCLYNICRYFGFYLENLILLTKL